MTEDTTDAVMAELAALKMENEQYKKKCDNKCGCVLGYDVPIMCWQKFLPISNVLEEMTLCSECYYDAGFWKDDENPDNEDEIREHKEDESEDESDDESEEECEVCCLTDCACVICKCCEDKRSHYKELCEVCGKCNGVDKGSNGFFTKCCDCK